MNSNARGLYRLSELAVAVPGIVVQVNEVQGGNAFEDVFRQSLQLVVAQIDRLQPRQQCECAHCQPGERIVREIDVFQACK